MLFRWLWYTRTYYNLIGFRLRRDYVINYGEDTEQYSKNKKYETCPESKCTEALTTVGIIFSFILIQKFGELLRNIQPNKNKLLLGKFFIDHIVYQ